MDAVGDVAAALGDRGPVMDADAVVAVVIIQTIIGPYLVHFGALIRAPC